MLRKTYNLQKIFQLPLSNNPSHQINQVFLLIREGNINPIKVSLMAKKIISPLDQSEGKIPQSEVIMRRYWPPINTSAKMASD